MIKLNTYVIVLSIYRLIYMCASFKRYMKMRLLSTTGDIDNDTSMC